MSSDITCVIRVLEAYGLAKADLLTNSDPFVIARLKGHLKFNSARTSTIRNNNNPVWNQELKLRAKHATDILLLKVYDKDIGKDDLLGMCEIPLEQYLGVGFQDLWMQLCKKKGGLHKQFISVPGHIHIQLWAGSTAEVTSLPPAQYCQSTFNNAVAPPFTKETISVERTLGSAFNPVVTTNTVEQTQIRNNNGGYNNNSGGLGGNSLNNSSGGLGMNTSNINNNSGGLGMNTGNNGMNQGTTITKITEVQQIPLQNNPMMLGRQQEIMQPSMGTSGQPMGGQQQPVIQPIVQPIVIQQQQQPLPPQSRLLNTTTTKTTTTSNSPYGY